MTPNCKHCGNDIDETHITEEIGREGETVTRHYCSARCLTRDKGYHADDRLVEDTEDDENVTTYGDVAERELGALFNGTETEPNAGEA
jgi:endogenous inhibitor of DNA gyrase (YacG/DUF329 family)